MLQQIYQQQHLTCIARKQHLTCIEFEKYNTFTKNAIFFEKVLACNTAKNIITFRGILRRLDTIRYLIYFHFVNAHEWRLNDLLFLCITRERRMNFAFTWDSVPCNREIKFTLSTVSSTQSIEDFWNFQWNGLLQVDNIVLLYH